MLMGRRYISIEVSQGILPLMVCCCQREWVLTVETLMGRLETLCTVNVSLEDKKKFPILLGQHLVDVRQMHFQAVLLLILFLTQVQKISRLSELSDSGKI
jgi:hypothetical protein